MNSFTSASTPRISSRVSAPPCAEIEPQSIRRVQRAALRNMVAKRAAQSLVQQMRCRVVGADLAAARVINLQRDANPGASASPR